MGFCRVALEVSHLANVFVERMIFWWRVIIVIGVGMLTWQLIFDRQVPFKVNHVSPAQVHAGEQVTIVAAVWRDTKRDCAVAMDRYVYDADLQRTDYARASFSPNDIRDMEVRDPGMMRPTVAIATNAACGPASLVTNLYYSCNQAQQWLLPIHVRVELPFTVLCR
jgi:hypothetical protein